MVIGVLIYILIFTFKVLENSLGTLRMILIANGKKQIGAILQLVISLIWILSTSMVITNIIKDYFKIISNNYIKQRHNLGKAIMTSVGLD